MICIICKKEIKGYGHNPFPVRFNGRCCDKCNSTYVIPTRIMLMSKNK